MSTFSRILVGFLIISIIIYFCAVLFERSISEDVVEITIKNIEKITTEDGEIYHIIYTNRENFVNRDHYFHNKSNSRELQAKLKPKGTYKFKVVGYNLGIEIPLLLNQRNIVEIVESKTFYKVTPKEY